MARTRTISAPRSNAIRTRGERRPSRASALPPEFRNRTPGGIYPVHRQELFPIAMASLVLGFLAFLVCARNGWLLLYGDAVAHLGIARRILDARYPGLAQLGGVWLPLPHLLMLPFVQRMDWWQNGFAGAMPSLLAYICGNLGLYRLARTGGAHFVGLCRYGVHGAEPQPALPVHDSDDGAALSRASRLVDSYDDGGRRRPAREQVRHRF